jgi:hypothetical protein
LCSTKSVGKTASGNAESKVKKYLPGYEKGKTGLYADLKPRKNTAITNAKKLKRHNEETDSENPATNFDELVGYLIALRP